MYGINEGYHIKLDGVYETICSSCGEKTRVQRSDGIGLCGSCGFEWEYNDNTKVGFCYKCNIDITVKNWLEHFTKIDDQKEHPPKSKEYKVEIKGLSLDKALMIMKLLYPMHDDDFEVPEKVNSGNEHDITTLWRVK